jgi:hypothetical protein
MGESGMIRVGLFNLKYDDENRAIFHDDTPTKAKGFFICVPEEIKVRDFLSNVNILMNGLGVPEYQVLTFDSENANELMRSMEDDKEHPA